MRIFEHFGGPGKFFRAANKNDGIDPLGNNEVTVGRHPPRGTPLTRLRRGCEYRLDSEAVDESFWDGQGVEIGATKWENGYLGR